MVNYASDANVYEHNRLVSNYGYGMFIDTATSKVIGNYAAYNGRDGIFLTEDAGEIFLSGYLIAGNVARFNRGLGIRACFEDRFTDPDRPDLCAPGMIDGGGNEASGNGDSRQCVNVVCAEGSAVHTHDVEPTEHHPRP